VIFSQQSPCFEVDGRDWPNRETSHFVTVAGLDWHCQYYEPPERHGANGRKQGKDNIPRALLLHGTGAATHSWRDFGPALSRHGYLCLAPDLPGHGFTSMPTTDGLSLSGMARLFGALLAAEGFQPDIVIGHSAGAAIALAMVLQGTIKPKAVFAINGAFRPIRGNTLFSPLAKLFFINPMMPKMFAWRAASPDAVERLIRSTGSSIDTTGARCYATLLKRSGHIAGALGMMANWDLEELQRKIPAVDVPVILIAARHDKAVPPEDAASLAARLASGEAVMLEHGGHLVHEEDPEGLARLIVAKADPFMAATD